MARILDFSRLTNRAGLLDALGVDEQLFQMIIEFDPPPPQWLLPPDISKAVVEITIPAFFRHDIPKRNKARGHRTVWEPFLASPQYKALARRLNLFFAASLPGYPSDRAFGYRSGLNIKENAKQHSGHKYRLSVDIKDFFPSISRDDISALLVKLEVRTEIAELLARFVTIGGRLPMGLPTSPTISNAIAVPIDAEFHSLALATASTYTRYSDDITFSGERQLPHTDEVAAVLSRFGFEIAEHKTRYSKLGQAHYVTGLSISDPERPHVPRETKRQLRQTLYFAQKHGLADHFQRRGINDQKVVQREVNRLDGLIKFVAHHEPKLATNLKQTWRGLLKDNGMRTSYASRGERAEPFLFLIDESEFTVSGERVLAICIVATQHVEDVIESGNSIVDTLVNDPWSDADLSTLRKKGLHYADATEDMRLRYATKIATMPVEGYVAFARYREPAEYEDTYIRLLSIMMPRRLMACENRLAIFLFEVNSKVTKASIEGCVRGIQQQLKVVDSRRPGLIAFEYVSKPNLAISVPDFLLGVLGAYLRPPKSGRADREPREHLMFERLRDKFRLILDVDSGVEFSRRRPIHPGI